jgi:hypothetical protein
MEISMEVPQKLKVELPYDLAISLLGIYPEESKLVYYRDSYIPMCITAVFITAKLWNLSRCPSMDEWIQKMWYMYTMEFYSAIKKNEIMLFTGKWMKLEIIT